MNLPTILLCLIALIFALLGMAKMLALGPMPKMAAHVGFSTTGYRVIGSLELAGAVGVTLGPDQGADPGLQRDLADEGDDHDRGQADLQALVAPGPQRRQPGVAEVGELPGQLHVGGHLAAPPTAVAVLLLVGAGLAVAVAVFAGAPAWSAVTSHRPERAVIVRM
ncbi:DoxX family protein [Actinacidiphila soli]|uniref:DoxX family protein n=1 Tax=Actinacidiphila soli TaxID=2487275 RepID=UPI0019D1E9A0|nr:DoxX family protein [Actinacidiphila soli]